MVVTAALLVIDLYLHNQGLLSLLSCNYIILRAHVAKIIHPDPSVLYLSHDF